jgi:cell division protease FtsH
MALDRSIIDSKRAVLETVKQQLKKEFFGLDNIIDKVVDSLSAWYIFPELITRPVIINLWGMTGVGKTQLVRRIVSMLEFGDRFVEVVMDGGSTHGYWSNSLSAILSQSKIEEGKPGILLLDEIQRFRTVADDGTDVKVERYQDVWTLLSDGKFSSDSSLFNEMEMMMASRLYDDDSAAPSDNTEGETKSKKKKIHPWEAKNIKKLLRLPNSVSEIITWSTDDIMNAMREVQESRSSWEIDYTKLIIFISGNLDTAFAGANSTEDSDTDADFYHEITSNLSVNEIKKNLLRRFRPEQIARMGNNHIIYPSMSKLSYQKLIESTCKRYTSEMTAVSDIKFELDKSLLDQIYENSVFPTQGTRPVFSSIHKIFSNLLVNVTFWAVENDIKDITLTMNSEANAVRAIALNAETVFPVEFDMNERKKKASPDFKALVAAHEAGHAIVYALTTKTSPFEVKVNITSFNGGYMLPPPDNEAVTRATLRDNICCLLSGRAAEEIVFGLDNACTGAGSDLIKATENASHYVRRFGFDGIIGYVDSSSSQSINWMTMMSETDPTVKQLLIEEYTRAKTMISEHLDYYKHITNLLIKNNTVTQEEFIAESASFIKLEKSKPSHPFLERWKQFDAK